MHCRTHSYCFIKKEVWELNSGGSRISKWGSTSRRTGRAIRQKQYYLLEVLDGIYTAADDKQISVLIGLDRSGSALCQCHRVTSAAPLASSPAKNQLQACRHHVQDQLNQNPGLPVYHSRVPSYTCTLRSADKLLLVVPRMSLTLSAKAFCVSAPSVWNSLSYNSRGFIMLNFSVLSSDF